MRAIQTGIRGCWTGVGRRHHVAEPVVRALVAESLATPQPGEHIQALVQLLRPHSVTCLLAERAKLEVGRIPKPYAQRQPPAREPVDRHGLPRQLLRAAARDRRHHRPDPDPLGRERDRR